MVRMNLPILIHILLIIVMFTPVTLRVKLKFNFSLTFYNTSENFDFLKILHGTKNKFLNYFMHYYFKRVFNLSPKRIRKKTRFKL